MGGATAGSRAALPTAAAKRAVSSRPARYMTPLRSWAKSEERAKKQTTTKGARRKKR